MEAINKPRSIKLRHHLSPGDVTVMTAALESLHQQFPGQYLTDVDTCCNAIFENNPHVTKLHDALPIEMHYPLIHKVHMTPVHFMQGYTDYLGDRLNIPLKLTVRHPSLYLSEEEKTWTPQVEAPFWLINAGIKSDFTNKNWGFSNYQEVVYRLNFIKWVQVGEKGHLHKPLDGAIDLIGKTTPREFIRLCYWAAGGLGPVTWLHHVMAAFAKPYVCLLGGREQLWWEYYPTATMMSTLGTLPCCQYNGCWKSRTVKLNDNSTNDKSLCEMPVLRDGEHIPKCMEMISVDNVCEAIMRYSHLHSI